MPVSVESMQTWCRTLLETTSQPSTVSLEQFLADIPTLESLSDVPAGTPVLIRGDLDAKPGEKIGDGDIRLRSLVETLKYGQERQWKQIVFGHIGRKPEGSLDKVAVRIGELLGCEVALIDDWVDESGTGVSDQAAQQIKELAPGSVVVLQNTRKYDIERVLWKAEPDDVDEAAAKLAPFCNEVAEKLADVYVNEALAAGSMDSSSTVVPAAMRRVAFGKYIRSEFSGPMQQCLKAGLVVFSGIKIDKMDDLEAMINRGAIRMVISAGSLAMALLKAEAELAGRQLSLGVAEDDAHAGKPYYIPRERIEQAKQMLADGKEKGIEFVLPIDFTLGDERHVDQMEPGDQQFDIGPKTTALFEEKVGQFIESAGSEAVAFHNGVFGMFEDTRFEAGTRNFVAQLKRMTDAGVKVYIGGGEGGKSLDRYGEPDWVTHCFTAGGTVLNALGSNPVPYLVALRMAATQG